MFIIIHRGSRQIGGCVTEIASGDARIFIDLGRELPGDDGVMPEETMVIEGVTAGTPRCDGVFFTHAHEDHLGQIGSILPEIPLYLGETAKVLQLALNKRLDAVAEGARKPVIAALERAKTFQMNVPVKIKDITVTPYFIDHSAFDAYMFLIEAEGKRVLHTGDFRLHGFRGPKTIPILEHYVKQVDLLICEGTMLSRENEITMTERELQTKAKELMKKYKRVFVLCSSMNIDRIAGFIKAAPDKRRIIMDDYQKGILDIINEHHGDKSRLYNSAFDNLYTYYKHNANPGLDSDMQDCGFLAFIRPNEWSKRLLEKHGNDALIIYSQWRGYLYGKTKNQRVLDLLKGRKWRYLHTSGHVTEEGLKEVIETVMPKEGIIPIHCEVPEKFRTLFPDVNIVLVTDGEIIAL